MATTNATLVKPGSKAGVDVAASFRSIVSELGDRFLERREIIEALVVTMLAKQHGFMLGPPGTGKSALARAITSRITDAKYFEVLLDRQLGKEELFGPIDIPMYDKTGKWVRNIQGTLADCHVAFVDEVGKAGPAVLNSMLTAFNERTFKANGAPALIPLVSAIGASNELLEPELAAMWDRFLVRIVVDYIQEAGNFAALLAQPAQPVGPQTTVDLADFQRAIDTEVPAVQLPPGVIDTVQQLRVDLRAETIIPSDRRWKQCMDLVRANAYLQGRSTVDDDDLQILRYALWDVAEQVPTVERKVLSLTSETTRGAIELQSQIEEIDQQVEARRGQAVDKRAAYGGEAQFKLNEITKKLADLKKKALQSGRSVTRLNSVEDRLKALRVKVLVETLNVPAERAEKMV